MSSQAFGGSAQSSYGSTSQRGGGTFEEQSKTISSLVFKITSNAAVLERTAKKIGTKDDGPQLREKLHSIQQETNKRANEITALMKTLTDSVGRGDKTQRLQAERLKTSFRTQLERYGHIQKKVSEQLKAGELKTHSRTNTFDEEPDTWSDEANLLEQERRREQLQQQQVIIEDDLHMARDREERIRQLESDILDVNEIFKELGTMVYEQGDMIDTIETNIVRASDNVDSGNTQLHQAASYQKSYRKKLCVLAIILFIVLAAVGIVLGVELGGKH